MAVSWIVTQPAHGTARVNTPAASRTNQIGMFQAMAESSDMVAWNVKSEG
jgi:hypothetical protein